MLWRYWRKKNVPKYLRKWRDVSVKHYGELCILILFFAALFLANSKHPLVDEELIGENNTAAVEDIYNSRSSTIIINRPTFLEEMAGWLEWLNAAGKVIYINNDSKEAIVFISPHYCLTIIVQMSEIARTNPITDPVFDEYMVKLTAWANMNGNPSEAALNDLAMITSAFSQTYDVNFWWTEYTSGVRSVTSSILLV